MSTLYRCRGSLSEIAAMFGAEPPPGLQWQPSIWPDSNGLIVRMRGDRPVLEQMRWGIPDPRPLAPSSRTRRRAVPYIRDLFSPIAYADALDPPVTA